MQPARTCHEQVLPRRQVHAQVGNRQPAGKRLHAHALQRHQQRARAAAASGFRRRRRRVPRAAAAGAQAGEGGRGRRVGDGCQGCVQQRGGRVGEQAGGVGAAACGGAAAAADGGRRTSGMRSGGASLLAGLRHRHPVRALGPSPGGRGSAPCRGCRTTGHTPASRRSYPSSACAAATSLHRPPRGPCSAMPVRGSTALHQQPWASRNDLRQGGRARVQPARSAGTRRQPASHPPSRRHRCRIAAWPPRAAHAASLGRAKLS